MFGEIGDKSFIPITFFFPNMPNPFRSKCVAARAAFEKMFIKVVEERKASGASYDDFLQVLMDAKYKDGRPLTMAEITGIMVGTLLGGQHTSNVTGTWTLCHLLNSPEWMERVMDEQRALLHGDLSQHLGYDEVEQMAEFDKVLDEALRLQPA